MLENMGPCRQKITGFGGCKISVPMRSAGSKSGVNWMREKGKDKAAASARTVSVFASPLRRLPIKYGRQREYRSLND